MPSATSTSRASAVSTSAGRQRGTRTTTQQPRRGGVRLEPGQGALRDPECAVGPTDDRRGDLLEVGHHPLPGAPQRDLDRAAQLPSTASWAHRPETATTRSDRGSTLRRARE